MLLISPTYFEWWTYHPTGLGWIASSLERAGRKPKILDCRITEDYKNRILEILNNGYSVVGISTNIGTISSAIEIATFIRQNSPKTRIIFGGPHATAVYERLIPKYADIVVLGEGEDTIAELVQERDLSKIKGIAYWDGCLKVNERRPLIEDLDRLGFPAWHLYDLEKYKSVTLTSFFPCAIITTSRGCPNQCIYCTKFVHGYKIRMRSIENVLKEIDYLVNDLKVREIEIRDDNFTFYPERVKEFCQRVIGRRYRNLRFSLPNGIRADIGDAEMFRIMAQAGFYSVCIGVESGSQEVADRVGRMLQLDVIKKTIRMIKKAGMLVRLNLMIGLPFDTAESIRKTIDFAKSLPGDSVSFAMAIPFPGTKFYEMVEKKGKFLHDLSVTSASADSGAVYELGSLRADGMNKMHRQAYREFYFRCSRIWHFLNRRIYSFRMVLGIFKSGLDMLFPKRQLKHVTD